MAVLRDRSEHQLLLACAWVNHGGALLRTQPVRAAEARVSAATALELARPVEAQDRIAAETSLKAQLIICQAVAELLEAVPGPAEPLDLVCAATDAVEAGLRTARRWVDRGEAGFGPLLGDLARFGLAVYRRHQPQFVTEFIAENLPGSGDVPLHAMAVAALAAEARRVPPDGFASVNTPRFARWLETLRALRLAEGRLRELSAVAGQDSL